MLRRRKKIFLRRFGLGIGRMLKKDKNIQEIPVNKLTFLLLMW